MPNLWQLPRPLVLASKSAARRALLAAAGIPFEAIDAAIDEREVEAPAREQGVGGEAIAALLAREKAMAVSAGQPDRLVLGADQTLSIEGRFLTKPGDRDIAHRQLVEMAGKTHTLHAAVCLVRDGEVVATTCAEAHMTCRAYSSEFVGCYLDLAGDSVLQSVGGYAVEGLGIHLFEKVDGDQSTILGLPMLHLLRLLRDCGAVEIEHPKVIVPKACVIGWPVAHSRSPLIHGHWLQTNGIAGTYEKAPVAPEDFAAFVDGMWANGFVGGNVTIPHKGAAAARCDRLTETAQRLGSVNTLWFDGDILCGDTTDGLGFLGALDQEAPGWDARKGIALVLGAGGAAAPIADALRGRGFARVVVANRTAAKAEALAARLGCEAVGLDAVPGLLGSADLLVNTTSAGMAGEGSLALDLAALPAHAVVDDIVYVPRVTPLLARAEARGLRIVGGLGMLLHQAAPGFARWFGTMPEVTPDLRALVERDIARGSK